MTGHHMPHGRSRYLSSFWKSPALTAGNSYCVAHCFETDPRVDYLLRDATVHAHKGWGVGQPFICGDYFFLEALLILEGSAPDFWGP